MENQCFGEAARSNAAADAINESSGSFSALGAIDRQPPCERVGTRYGMRQPAKPRGQRREGHQQEHAAGKLHVGHKPAD